MCLSNYVYFYLSAYLSISQSTNLCTYLSCCLSVYLSVCFEICPSVCVPVYLAVFFILLSVYLPTCKLEHVAILRGLLISEVGDTKNEALLLDLVRLSMEELDDVIQGPDNPTS